MKGLEDLLFPYLFVQAISLLFLLASSRRPRLGRLMFAVLFLYAAVYNMELGLTEPEIYLMLFSSALPLYRDVIEGWFSTYHHILIPCFAMAQFLLGTAMLLQGNWVKGACIAAIVFFLLITPLMGGSWFPFSIILSLAVFRILKRDHKEFIWKSTVPRKLFSR